LINENRLKGIHEKIFFNKLRIFISLGIEIGVHMKINEQELGVVCV